MRKNRTLLVLAALLCQWLSLHAQSGQVYEINSPNQHIKATINTAGKLTWSVNLDGQTIIKPSAASIKLSTDETLGKDMQVQSAKTENINTSFTAVNYKKKTVKDQYQQLTLNCPGYSVIFRAYNDGVAYRFVTNRNVPLMVNSEEVNFNFSQDYNTYIPYVREPRKPGDQYQTSFEALYDERPLSGFLRDSLAMLPLVIDLGNGGKAGIIEAGLENYPGMLIQKGSESFSLKGTFARYPLQEKPGGYNLFNNIVEKRANYIATTNGNNQFPWRAVIIARQDKDLANNDMVQKLAPPLHLSDVSWIKPGKVAWDWWNDWNISHVNFRAGINTQTYKYYIDFAAANHLEYIIMDEGWSDPLNLQIIKPKIALQEIIDYGRKKDVGVILWATWRAVMDDTDGAFKKYSQIGAKGFKIDFFDRDDEKSTASSYQIAKIAAQYHLMVDYHGFYKPEGLQRAYPNVINYEGVRGLENAKWAPSDDVPRYDVSLPFIRMLAGPLDYTPGAMRNATKANYRPINANPMSQGTRTHQLAMYVVFEAPLQMLADNPTIYMKEQESTNFISKIPTVFDETVALDGKIAEYIVLARRKNNIWYVGAMTNWTARDLEIDCSFLPAGTYEAEVFQDGINADRDATDYQRKTIKVTNRSKLKIHLANGGGWAARIYPSKAK